MRIAQFLCRVLLRSMSISWHPDDLSYAGAADQSRSHDALPPPILISDAEAAQLSLPVKTRLDFGEAPCESALRSDATRANHTEGQAGWSWFSDTSKQKFGWIVTRSTGDVAVDGIAFAFSTGGLGRVRLGYLKSYSDVMGRAKIDVQCEGEKKWKRRILSLTNHSSVVLDGLWSNHASLYQDHAIGNLLQDSACVLTAQVLAPPSSEFPAVKRSKFKILLLVSD